MYKKLFLLFLFFATLITACGSGSNLPGNAAGISFNNNLQERMLIQTDQLPVGSSDRTYAYWVKVTEKSVDPKGLNSVFWYAPQGCLANENSFVNSEGLVYLNTNCAYVRSTKKVDDGAWHSVVITYTSGPINTNTMIYIDGVEDTTTFGSSLVSSARNTPSTTYLTLGCTDTSDASACGGQLRVYDLQIWTRALTAEEAHQLYATGEVSQKNGLVVRVAR